ncbi:DUF4238 domain-containing protein [Psychrobacter sp.]|uniref:DUF4238 domain-containing protein n=2 Tax=unclassified Psychrobacter TaxID=196806 RepID=UPI003F9C9AFC
MTTDVKKQHTVPRFLLDKFSFETGGKRNRLFTFDKLNEKRFEQTVFNATTMNSFYNFVDHPDSISLEPVLGIYEDQAAPLIKKIVEEQNIHWLSEKNMYIIAEFIAVQQSRTNTRLQLIERIASTLDARLTQMNPSGEKVETGFGAEGSSDRKNVFLDGIVSQAEVISILLKKSWILFETTKENPFFISDNPVTLYNSINMGLYGNLGITLEGIEIYIPLSSTITLGLICPSISKLKAQQAAEISSRPKILDVFNQLNASQKKLVLDKANQTETEFLQAVKNLNSCIEMAKSFEDGTSYLIQDEKLKHLNSLQVAQSERYVFSGIDDFEVVQKMLAMDEQYKYGPSVKIG